MCFAAVVLAFAVAMPVFANEEPVDVSAYFAMGELMEMAYVPYEAVRVDCIDLTL